LISAQTLTNDPAHSKLGFSANHLTISQVEGHFKDFNVTLSYTKEDLSDAKFTVTAKIQSIDTGVEPRDNHLRSADFFDVEAFPTINFQSTDFEKSGDDSVTLEGLLTIRGITKPITIKGEQLGPVKNPMTGTRSVGYSLTGELSREDFGLTWNKAMESGGVMVGKKVTINIDVEVAESE